MNRRHQRRAMLTFLFVVAGVMVLLGFNGWWVQGMPAQCLGYLLAALGVAEKFGVNIWYGGPLDPRDDPPEPPGTPRAMR